MWLLIHYCCPHYPWLPLLKYNQSYYASPVTDNVIVDSLLLSFLSLTTVTEVTSVTMENVPHPGFTIVVLTIPEPGLLTNVIVDSLLLSLLSLTTVTEVTSVTMENVPHPGYWQCDCWFTIVVLTIPDYRYWSNQCYYGERPSPGLLTMWLLIHYYRPICPGYVTIFFIFFMEHLYPGLPTRLGAVTNAGSYTEYSSNIQK